MHCTIKFLVSIFALVTLIPGCALVSDNTFQGAARIIEDKGDFTKVDLPAVLDPNNYGHPSSRSDGISVNRDDLENAFSGFYNKEYGDVKEQKLRRNRILGRLIAASVYRCKTFGEDLKLAQGQGNFTFGTLTAALAGAGAIVTPESTTRALAGSAAILSGMRAEFNETLFASKFVEVLTRAIDNRRDEVLAEIDKKTSKSIEEYPVERAISDALQYHSTCNLLTGLELINEQVTVANDPGLKRLNAIFSDGSLPSTIRIGDTTITTSQGTVTEAP